MRLIHRNKTHAFLYVLEVAIVMQVKGGKEIALTQGKTFYKGPNDIHAVGRNTNRTGPAKFVGFFVKGRDAPVLVPIKRNQQLVGRWPYYSPPTRRH